MIAENVLNTKTPPLVTLGKYASQHHDCISLGQGAPYYNPPIWIFEEFQEMLKNESIHRYTADPGLELVRQSIITKIREDQRVRINLDQLILTPGANQAFYNVLVTIANPGEEVILFSPYYFNHQMACTMLNINVKTIPLLPDFGLDLEMLKTEISSKTRAVVIVNPGNPTGKVHSRKELSSLIDICQNKNIYLIADETYEYFTYNKTTHYPIASLTNNNPLILSISSFSKTFGIPGWRLGYYYGSERIIEESLKVQDTIGICAPRPSQMLATILIEHRKKLLPPIVELMQSNHYQASKLLDGISWLHPTPSDGAYYLFPSQTSSIPSHVLARRLIREAGVYIVPGKGFGESWNEYFRISFANVKSDELEEAFQRLSSFVI